VTNFVEAMNLRLVRNTKQYRKFFWRVIQKLTLAQITYMYLNLFINDPAELQIT